MSKLINGIIDIKKLEESLLPCPFCGSKAILNEIGAKQDKYLYDIKCSNDTCFLGYGADYTYPEDEIQELFDLWNKRETK